MSKIKIDTSHKDTTKGKHVGHDNHICELIRRREIHKIARLVKDSKYICLVCGRTAADENSICVPIEI